MKALFKILSILLSIVLVVALIATVLLASVKDLLTPDTIVEMISDVDYKSVLGDSLSKAKTRTDTLSFSPYVMMGGVFYNSETGESFVVNPGTEKGEVSYDVPLEEESSAGGPPDNITYIDENDVVSFKGNSTNISDYTIDEDGNVILNGEIIGSLNSGDGNKHAFTIVEGATVEESGENSFSTSIIGGADKSEEHLTVQQENASIPTIGASNENVDEEKAKELAMAFLETDAGKEIINEYGEAVNDALQGGEGEIDEEKIKEIIIENKDEIYDFYEEYTGEKLNREEIDAELDKVLDENIDELVSQLPAPKELVGEIPDELLFVVEIINNDTLFTLLIVGDFLLMALIFVMRLWGLKGFLWLSVNGIVTSVLLAIIYFAITILKGIVINEGAGLATVANAIIGALLSNIMFCLIIIFAVSVVCMVAHFIIKFFKNKAKKILTD